ncbi:MAG TPA: helix-turn-helix domain-containing protein, partial [Agromyces sp.]
MTATDAQRGPVTTEPTPPTSPVASELHAASAPGAAIFGRSRALRPTGKVLPEHARTHNRALVLQTLYTAGAQSRADVARGTGLTRVTISDLVGDLIAEGLVIELGQREDARPGKPATLIDIDREAFHIIGVDLSEHEVFRGAVVGLDGQIIGRDEVARDGATAEAAELLVELLVERLLARTTTPVLGIGI